MFNLLALFMQYLREERTLTSYSIIIQLLMSGVAAFSENALYIMILPAPFFTVNLTVYSIKNPGVEFKLLFSCRDS